MDAPETIWTNVNIVATLGQTLQGNTANDILSGINGNEILYGGAGNDILNGESGDDTLSGDSGNDILNGGAGNDTYIFDTSFGNDTIIDSEGINRILFQGGITPEKLSISIEGNDTIITLTETQDKLRFKDFLLTEANRNFTLEFENGRKYSIDCTNLNLDRMYTGNDSLYTFNTDSQSFAINDVEGDDTIRTNADILSLLFMQNDNDLEIINNQNGNYVNITDWYATNTNQIETIETDDGYSITNTQVQLLIENMASFTTANNISWSQAIETGNVEAKNIVEQFWVKSN